MLVQPVKLEELLIGYGGSKRNGTENRTGTGFFQFLVTETGTVKIHFEQFKKLEPFSRLIALSILSLIYWNDEIIHLLWRVLILIIIHK